MITAKRLLEVLHYAPDTGDFTWVSRSALCVIVGTKANSVNKHGYVHVRIDKKRYLAHRLAFLYMTGNFPKWQVDHINGVRHDNRWCNLRDVPQEINMHNLRKKNGTSKYMGVSYYARWSKWQAQIQFGGKQHHLGYFDTEEEAYRVYVEMKHQVHPGSTLT